MAGTLRLSNTGTGNGQSTITTAASGDTTYTLPSGGGTFVTTSSTQALTVPFASGTASAPSVTFLGDSNTGIYSPGADQVAVATNGTGRLFIDASGNVGVGTSSVNALLEVNNSTAGGEVQRIEGNYDGSGSVTLTNWRRAGGSVAAALKYNDDSSPLCMSIGTTTSHEFRIRTADTDAITIDASQRVGIGTSSPQASARLHVYATGDYIDESAPFTVGDSTAGGMRLFFGINNTSNYGYIGSVESATAYRSLVLQPGGGNVGIGVTGPSEKLDVNGAVRVTNESAGWGSGAEGGFIDYYSPASLVRFGHLNGASGSAKNVVCYTGGSEAFRVDSNRRLLVGTSSNYSNYRLQIEGTDGAGSGMSIRRSQSGNASPPILVFAKNRSGTLGGNAIVQSGDYLGSILFRGNDGSSDINAAHIESFVDGTPGANDMPGRLTFSTTADGASSPTERLRIDSSGRVGIGTTSPSRRLTVNSTTTGNINYVRLQETTTNTPTNGGSFIELGGTRSNGTYGFYGGILGGRRFQGGDNTGYLAFYTDNNDGESLAERVRIDHLGRLLVGTSTAPTNVYPTTAATTPSTVFDSDSNQLSFMLNNNSPSGNIVAFARRYTAAANGTIARLIFPQYDGTNYRTAAQIAAEIDGTPGTADMPGRLVFSTTADGASSPTERMRLDNKGAVSTFATNDTAFAVKNSATAGTTISNIAGFYSATGTGNGTASFRVYTNGNVVNTNNSYGAISDIKLKENIVDANSQWDDLKALQVRNYNFKEGQTHTQIGLVAQEAELVSPGLVYESPDRDEDGNDLGTVTKSVNYSVLYMKAVKALQEAIAKIETLEGMIAVNNITIDEQQHQLSTLAARLTALESA
jgi:hypothetical protein